MSWPPQVGELLPRHEEAVGIEERLRAYSLDLEHKRGWSKAKGFLTMVGIGLDSVDYLECQIRAGIAVTPISAIRLKTSGAVHCTVQFQIAGPGRYSYRRASLRTSWELADLTSPPALKNAYLRGKEHR